jgi:putative endonuclease
MGRDRKIEGALGEKMAVDYLKRQNYRILETNFRTRNGEIDIIAIDQNDNPPVLTFIEVKTRKTTEFGTPLEAIGYYKLKALVRTAQFYTISRRGLPESLRMDAVSVLLHPNNTLAHLELVKNIT